MSNRTQWRFPYTAVQLAKAATAQAVHHRGRESDYQRQADVFEAEMTEKGVQLRVVEVTGGKQFNASLDPALNRSYTDAINGASVHRDEAEKYERWARALGLTDPATVFGLDVDDVHYFAL